MKLLILYFSVCMGMLYFQSDWIKYTSKESGFTILVPGNMEKTKKEIPTDIGMIVFNTFQYNPKSDDRNALYIVHHYEYPEGLLSIDTTELGLELLEATVEESTITLNGSLDYKRVIEFNSNQGILYRVKYNNGKAVLKSKAIIIGDHIFVLQVYATIDNSINDQMDYFLDSFQHLRP